MHAGIDIRKEVGIKSTHACISICGVVSLRDFARGRAPRGKQKKLQVPRARGASTAVEVVSGGREEEAEAYQLHVNVTLVKSRANAKRVTRLHYSHDTQLLQG